MTVFITGIKSSVGQAIASRLEAAGIAVRGSSRQAAERSNGLEVFALGDDISPDCFRSVDAVVHAAWDIQALDPLSNIVGTRKVVEAARGAEVGCQIFISSLSARADAPTSYGQGKFETEKFFSGSSDYIIRPGLVAVWGGLFKRTVQMVRRWPLLPLLGGGRFRVPLISGPQLGECVLNLLLNRPAGPRAFNVYHPRLLTQREYIETISRMEQKRRIMITVPATALLFLLRTTEALGCNLTVRSANVEAAISNDAHIPPSDLAFLLGKTPSEAETFAVLRSTHG